MQQRRDSMLGYMAVLAVCMYLIEIWFAIDWLQYLYSPLAVVLVICSLWRLRGFNLYILLLLLIIAFYIFIDRDVHFTVMLASFGENMSLLGLFILVPLFGVYLSNAGYYGALSELIQKREEVKGAHPYRLGYGLTAFMGSILNLGSLPLIFRMGQESLSSFGQKQFALTLMRAFGFCMLFSPYFVNVGLVLVLYDLAWLEIAGFAVILAVIYTIMAALFFKRTTFANEVYQVKRKEEQRKVTEATVPGFVFYMLCLLLLSFLLELALPLNMLTVVTTLALVYPFIWALFKRMGMVYMQAAHEYMKLSFTRLYRELGIFITAGVIGAAIAVTGMGVIVSEWLVNISNGIVPVIIFILIMISILLALVGIHPVIIIIGLGSALSPGMFGMEPSVMAVVLLCAWALSTQLSPFSGSVLMTSYLADESSGQLTKKNVGFVMALVGVMTAVLTVFHIFQS